MLKGRANKLNIRISPFVLDLYKMLSEENSSDTIAWELSGNRFIIKDPITFASKVLPQYYKTNKFASFSRQLNIYGFHRVSDRRRTKQNQDTSAIIYSHQHFKRDQPDSLHLIQRTSGPYSHGRVKYSIPEPVTISKSPLLPSLPSPLSPVFPSFSANNTQPISEGRCGLTSSPETVLSCSNCKTLEQDIETLSKTIQYYISMLNERENASVIHTPISAIYEQMFPIELPVSFSPPSINLSYSAEDALPRPCPESGVDFFPFNYLQSSLILSNVDHLQ
ncbi:Flocculation suppression protein [Basidiobolus ranarum]|uniref:Flocculation suppression protein n=1 Tax=Basidiobolus ranarum TaxID=34480 RepID=A0ABR2VL94_9FUNG